MCAAPTRPPKCGTSGVTSTGYYIPKLLEEAVGAKFEIVTGYQARPGRRSRRRTRRSRLPVVYDHCAFTRANRTSVGARTTFVRVLYQTGKKRDARLKDVPTMHELMDKYKTPENVRQLAKVILIASDLGRPIVAPPSVPADRLKMLRDAFNKAVNDPQFLAEAERRKLEIDPSTAEEIDVLAKEAMITPPEVVERMKKVLGM